MLQQEQNVLPPLPEGRHRHRQGVQPVVEIPAEASLLHHLLQGLVGGRHDPHVHVDDAAAAHPHHFPLLEDSQQLHLHGGTHPLHLVQKQGSLVGKFKKPRASPLLRPGEGSLLVAEQLALQEIFRHGRHVDGDKRAAGPPGGAVHGVGQQLLSRPRLPHNQHRALRGRHLQQYFPGAPDAVRLPQHVVYGVFCHVPLLQQLIAQLILPGLHLVKPLHHRKGADALILPQHRHHRYGHIDPQQLGHPGRNLLPAPHGLVKWDVGEHFLRPPPHRQVLLHPGDLTGLAVAGKYLPLLIDAHQPLIQDLHQDVKLALQPPGPGVHQVEAVVAGGHGLEILLELLRLRQPLKPQPHGNLDHHPGCAGAVSDVQHRLHPIRHKPLLVRRHRQLHRFLQNRPRIEGDKMDMVHPQGRQLGNRLPPHGLRHIHKQGLRSLWNLPQLFQGIPGVGDLDPHDLRIDGDVPGHLLRRAVGIGGDDEEIRRRQFSRRRTVPHAVGPHFCIISKQSLDLFPVERRCPGIQSHHRNRFHLKKLPIKKTGCKMFSTLCGPPFSVLFVSQDLIELAYQHVTVNAVNHASLLQRLSLGCRAS